MPSDSKMVNLRVPPDWAEALKRVAESYGLSVSRYILEHIRADLERDAEVELSELRQASRPTNEQRRIRQLRHFSKSAAEIVSTLEHHLAAQSMTEKDRARHAKSIDRIKRRYETASEDRIANMREDANKLLLEIYMSRQKFFEEKANERESDNS